VCVCVCVCVGGTTVTGITQDRSGSLVHPRQPFCGHRLWSCQGANCRWLDIHWCTLILCIFACVAFILCIFVHIYIVYFCILFPDWNKGRRCL